MFGDPSWPHCCYHLQHRYYSYHRGTKRISSARFAHPLSQVVEVQLAGYRYLGTLLLELSGIFTPSVNVPNGLVNEIWSPDS